MLKPVPSHLPAEAPDLATTAEHVVQSLEGEGIVVVRDARADIDRVVCIELQHEPGRESELVRAATALGARIACIETRHYLQFDYDEAVADANSLMDVASRHARLAQLERFKRYIGELCEFEVRAIGENGGVAIIYRATADWHDDAAFAPPNEDGPFGTATYRPFLPR